MVMILTIMIIIVMMVMITMQRPHRPPPENRRPYTQSVQHTLHTLPGAHGTLQSMHTVWCRVYYTHSSHCALTHPAWCTFCSCEHHCKVWTATYTALLNSIHSLSWAPHTTQCANTRTQYAMCIHITHLQGSKAIFEISKRRCACLTMSPPLIFPDWPVSDVHLQLKALQCIFEWECTCCTVSSAHITHVPHIPICVHCHKFTASNL